MPPENWDARIWAAILGAIGAGISMQFVKGLTWAQNDATPTPFLDSIAVARQIDPVVMRQFTQDAIAKIVGSSRRNVRNILTGYSWKHLNWEPSGFRVRLNITGWPQP